MDVDEHDLAVCYEQLRSEVLGEERNVRHSLGWSHLVRHGMAGWMQALTLVSAEREVAERGGIVESALPWPQHEVVSVLAGMALGCFAEVA